MIKQIVTNSESVLIRQDNSLRCFMKITASRRIASITPYAFAEINKKVEALESSGVKAIDFGVGDPHDPPFESVIKETKLAVEQQKCSGYPSYYGHVDFRKTIAQYMETRFGVSIDYEKEVISSIGSKELIFNFPEAFVNPGDVVIIPNPAYPPYIRGTLFAEGKSYIVNLLEQNNFLPDLDSIPVEIWEKAKIIWVNYPNNPTTVFAPDDFFNKLLFYANKYDVIVGSDEAYIDNYHSTRPRSLLEFSKKGVVSFFSFSKMANMTMFRVGYACGDERIISILKKLKTNIDSGTPTFIQLGALKALSDHEAQNRLRESYVEKQKLLQAALSEKGFPLCSPKGTIYIWQKVPNGYTGLTLAKRFLEPDIGIVVTPGQAISSTINNVNPGQDFVRFSLTPTIDEIKIAAQRIRAASF